MLAYARKAVGKPFSGMAMARALLWPRQTDHQSFFCAELVAAILQEGGLLDRSSNAGGATPQSLYTLYVSRAASTANPYALSQIKQSMAQQSAQQHLLDSGLSASMASALAYGAPPLPSANGAHAHAHAHAQPPPQSQPPPPPQHVGGSFRPPCDRFAATGYVDGPVGAQFGGGGGGGGGGYPLLSATQSYAPPHAHAHAHAHAPSQPPQPPQAQHLQTPPRPTPVLQNHRGAPSSACIPLANALAVAGAGAPPATATATARRYHGRNESPPRQRFKPVGASSLAHVTMHAPPQHAHAHAQQQLALSLHSLNFAKPRGA